MHFFNGTGVAPTAAELAAPADSDKLQFDCADTETPYKLVKDKDCQQMCIPAGDDVAATGFRAFVLSLTGVTLGECKDDHLGDYLGASVTVKVYVRTHNVAAASNSPGPTIE